MNAAPPLPVMLAPSLMPLPMPAFYAQVLNVIDGDTIKIMAWKWDDTYAIWDRARLARVNAPELATPAGLAARAFVRAWTISDPLMRWPFIVYTQSRDNYGRPLIDLWRRADGANLSAALLASGNAVAYPVRGVL